jgi:hypothetical protein
MKTKRFGLHDRFANWWRKHSRASGPPGNPEIFRLTQFLPHMQKTWSGFLEPNVNLFFYGEIIACAFVPVNEGFNLPFTKLVKA